MSYLYHRKKRVLIIKFIVYIFKTCNMDVCYPFTQNFTYDPLVEIVNFYSQK